MFNEIRPHESLGWRQPLAMHRETHTYLRAYLSKKVDTGHLAPVTNRTQDDQGRARLAPSKITVAVATMAIAVAKPNMATQSW